MDNGPTLKVSKTEAAKCQLETAIRLWVNSEDPFSIHTLAAAAHQVFHDLGSRQGKPTTLRELPGVRPEYRARVRKAVNRPENYLKHADNDPDDLLDFNPEASEGFILDAITTYEALTKDAVPLFLTFKMWIFVQQPQVIKDEFRDAFTKIINDSPVDVTRFKRTEFFKTFLPCFEIFVASRKKS